MFKLCLLLLASLVISEEANTAIEYVTPSQVKSVGDSVELECIVVNETVPVAWQKIHSDGKVSLLSIIGELVIESSRYSADYVGNSKEAYHKLKIDNIQKEDAGTYRCIAIFPREEDRISKDSQLTVQ